MVDCPDCSIFPVTFRALVRIRGRKFDIITINERSNKMNNEQNKPVELTEKELEGIAGGGERPDQSVKVLTLPGNF